MDDFLSGHWKAHNVRNLLVKTFFPLKSPAVVGIECAFFSSNVRGKINDSFWIAPSQRAEKQEGSVLAAHHQSHCQPHISWVIEVPDVPVGSLGCCVTSTGGKEMSCCSDGLEPLYSDQQKEKQPGSARSRAPRKSQLLKFYFIIVFWHILFAFQLDGWGV